MLSKIRMLYFLFGQKCVFILEENKELVGGGKSAIDTLIKSWEFDLGLLRLFCYLSGRGRCHALHMYLLTAERLELKADGLRNQKKKQKLSL